MKPRNFTINIILTLCFIAQIVLSVITPQWQLMFFGIIGLIVLIPEWILSVKHRALYISFKAVVQVLLILVGAGLLLYGFVLYIAYDLSESLAEGCGGTISHSRLDKFAAEYYMFMVIPVLTKIIMNIVDFALYKKEREKYLLNKEMTTSAE